MHYANTYLEKPVVPDVKITGEGTTDVLKCMLNTGSDIYQGACKKRGSTLKEEYKKPPKTETVTHMGRPTRPTVKSFQAHWANTSAQKRKLINANTKIPTLEC